MTNKQADLPGIIHTAKPALEETFDWSGPDVIIERQPATAIYRNAREGVVIRQEATGDDEDDQFVYFASDDDVRILIAALQREIGDA